MSEDLNFLFSGAINADPEAVRAAAARTWEPGVEGYREPVETYLGWARTIHFWMGEVMKLATLDADEMTDLLRTLRAKPEGAEQEEALVSSMRALATQLGTATGAFVTMADRLETAAARIQLEDEANEG